MAVLKKLNFKKNKKKILIIISIVIVLIIAGCIAVNYQFITKDTSKKESNKNEVPELNTPKELQIVDSLSTSRPFAIMINNASDARKVQSGLQDAFIIYEIIVEGGITRYLALFMDQETARIGSIRSARHYFLDYALENDAIYVHHGQSPQAKNDFSNLGIDRIEVNEKTTGWRDKTLNVSYEHTLFTSIEKLKKGIKSIRTDRNQDLLLNYSVEEIDMAKIDNAQEANNVSIKYSGGTTSSYEYDKENKVYKRYVNGKEHKDYETNEQYTFKNIITYQVNNYTLNDGENKGRQELENIGSGSGYYISNGYSIPIKWEKKSRSSQTKYYYENGEELKVNDGNTFIQIQPKGQKLTIS